MRDNLYRPRQDGDEYSSLRGEPRKTSVFLSAQMHPFVTAAVLAGLGAAVVALLVPRSAYGRPRRRSTPARRYEAVERKSGNGHDRPTLGPGYRGGQQRAEGARAQPRH